MYNIQQFTNLIVIPACKYISAYSEDAETLLILTCANESMGGTYLMQYDAKYDDNNDIIDTSQNGAVGAYQMEETTYNDIWDNFLLKKEQALGELVSSGYYLATSSYNDGKSTGAYLLASCTAPPLNNCMGAHDLTEKSPIFVKPPIITMMHDIFYATIMARIFYLRIPEHLPDANNIEAVATYYKKYYNTNLGGATVEGAIANYNSFMSNK